MLLLLLLLRGSRLLLLLGPRHAARLPLARKLDLPREAAASEEAACRRGGKKFL